MPGIGGVILAAGGSTRLGQPKQLLAFRGETLVHAAARAAREGGCDIICIVTGHAAAEVERAVADLSPLIPHNAAWESGIGSSIRLGLKTVQAVSAVVLLTCDQPAVDAAIVRSLIAVHHSTRKPIVASSYAATLGIPALFHRSTFTEFEELPNNHGAKTIIQKGAARVAAVEFPDGTYDIDTPEDLVEWRTCNTFDS
jgi:molybdenum cofactor cytidylyltransferase